MRSEPQPNPNTSQSAFSRFKVSLGSAREDRLTAMEIASWIEDEVQKSHGSDLLQEPQHFSAFIPAISKGIASKLNTDSSTNWLEYEIREKLGYQSFQKPDKIAEAIRYISDKKLWEEVEYRMEISQREAKETLSNIVDRRNKIAHEADIDPSYGIGNRWPIDESMVGEVVGFIERLAESIHQILQDE